MVPVLGTVFSLPTSSLPPLAVGFMGLGTGYLIYFSQELFGWPKRGPSVDIGTGVWGIWLPGLMQLITGLFLFTGLMLGVYTDKPLYAAALAFTAYGVHWFGIGWNRFNGADSRTNTGMTVGYTLISVLGMITFFEAGDVPVAGLFIGLTSIYIGDFFSTLTPHFAKVGMLGTKWLGLSHLLTGMWLMYLMFATVLNFVNGFKLPL